MSESVAGIILAAGASQRMGQPKPLLLWRGKPFVCHVARTALDAGLTPVVIVIGAHAEEVWAALADLPVEIVYNPNWAEGQSTSVQAGLQSLPPETDAAVFLLADQPHIPAARAPTLPGYAAGRPAKRWLLSFRVADFAVRLAPKCFAPLPNSDCRRSRQANPQAPAAPHRRALR